MNIAEKLTTIAENQERVFEAGKKANNEAFWASLVKKYTNINGSYKDKESYSSTFSEWNGDMFYPTVNMYPEYANGMFAFFNQNRPLLNLKARLEEQGVTIDFSNCENFTYAFNQAGISHIPTISTVSCDNLSHTFEFAPVEYIEKCILKNDGTQIFTYTFSSCSKLKEIRFEGVIGNNISFVQSSQLSSDSVNSIINALMTITDGVSRTLTLHKTVKDNLTDEQIATITTEKGWTLA